MQRKIKVVHPNASNDNPPIPAEIIADAIVEISKGIKAIRNTRLSERAILVLLRDATGLSLNEIRRVLGALDDLEKMYLKKNP
jgi:hypothetical protein